MVYENPKCIINYEKNKTRIRCRRRKAKKKILKLLYCYNNYYCRRTCTRTDGTNEDETRRVRGQLGTNVCWVRRRVPLVPRRPSPPPLLLFIFYFTFFFFRDNNNIILFLYAIRIIGSRGVAPGNTIPSPKTIRRDVRITYRVYRDDSTRSTFFRAMYLCCDKRGICQWAPLRAPPLPPFGPCHTDNSQTKRAAYVR